MTDAIVQPMANCRQRAGRASTVATSNGSTGTGMMIDSRTANKYIARTANLVAAARMSESYCCFKNRQTGIGHHKSDLGINRVLQRTLCQCPERQSLLVRLKGLEPPLCHQKRILNPPRLPFRHSRIFQQENSSYPNYSADASLCDTASASFSIEWSRIPQSFMPAIVSNR